MENGVKDLNAFPNRSQIFKLVKNTEANGAWEDHKAMGPTIWAFDNYPNTKNVTRVQTQSVRVSVDLCERGAKYLESLYLLISGS